MIGRKKDDRIFKLTGGPQKFEAPADLVIDMIAEGPIGGPDQAMAPSENMRLLLRRGYFTLKPCYRKRMIPQRTRLVI